jgi:hypothetical protein
MLFLIKCWRRVLVFLAAGAACAKGAALPSEYDLKAVFLFHFTQFVEWPASAFASPDGPFVIGILGPDPFGHALENVVRGEMVGQHPIVVRSVRDLAAELRCQILYVSSESESLVDARQFHGAPVLTVGESTSFFDGGGIIQFFSDHRHVRLRVNLGEARAHSLVISAKLLRVAEVLDAGSVTLDSFEADGDPWLEMPGGHSQVASLDLIAARAGRPPLRLVGMEEIVADER